MSERPVKPKEYFAKLLDIPEDKIDYSDSLPTARADWEGAEVLFPVTYEEFQAVKEFISARRENVEILTAKPDGEKIKKIAILGERFPGIYLFENSVFKDDPLVDIGHDPKNAKRRSEIQKDWYAALQFFLSKVFYGRLRDNRMLEYYWRAYKVLDRNRLRLLQPDFSPDHLDLQMEREGVKNRYDRHMVIDTVNMIRNLNVWNNNIISYTLDCIRNGKITEIYKALVHKRDRGLHGIGPKRASVFIRDVVIIWELEKHLNTDEDIITCVPIDTHVQETCERIGLDLEQIKTVHVSAVASSCPEARSKLSDRDTKSLAKRIAHACDQEGVSPFYFDVGAWMLGMARKRIKFVSGKPMIRGTPVEQILRMFQTRMTEDRIHAKYQQLTLDDIRAAQTLDSLARLDLMDLVYG